MAAPYKNLVAWQRADDLFIAVHRLTLEKFPKYEKFELGGQIRRAAYSVPANIVEGNSPQHLGKSKQFLNIAAGSLSEVGMDYTPRCGLGIANPRRLTSWISLSVKHLRPFTV